MFVKGGQIVVDAERLRFIPNETNRYEGREPLSLSLPLTSFYSYAFRKALAEAFLFGYGRVETHTELIEVLRGVALYSVRLQSKDERKASSFKMPVKRLISLFDALDGSARFEEVIERNNSRVILSGEISRLMINQDGKVFTLDKASKLLIRDFLWNLYDKKGQKIRFQEIPFSFTSEVPFVRLTDIRLTVGNFKAPLDREIILKLLALC